MTTKYVLVFQKSVNEIVNEYISLFKHIEPEFEKKHVSNVVALETQAFLLFMSLHIIPENAEQNRVLLFALSDVLGLPKRNHGAFFNRRVKDYLDVVNNKIQPFSSLFLKIPALDDIQPVYLLYIECITYIQYGDVLPEIKPNMPVLLFDAFESVYITETMLNILEMIMRSTQMLFDLVRKQRILDEEI